MNKIKELRTAKGWTQDDLGKLLNVKRAAISKYESGKIPLTDDTLKLLSEIFKVSTDYLLGNKIVVQEEASAPKRPKELIKLIEQEEYTLNGQIATQEDREKLAKIIEALYWDAKEKNKRK